mmetsp:Transcript_96081/g.286767  ORF Transcript_96081/g.286767 Transcript_96081/m.286767 type:complete len:249 (-) Transcript_96081:259-1005(-)
MGSPEMRVVTSPLEATSRTGAGSAGGSGFSTGVSAGGAGPPPSASASCWTGAIGCVSAGAAARGAAGGSATADSCTLSDVAAGGADASVPSSAETESLKTSPRRSSETRTEPAESRQTPQGHSRTSGPANTSPQTPAHDPAAKRRMRLLPLSATTMLPSLGSTHKPVGMFNSPGPEPDAQVSEPATVVATLSPGEKRWILWLLVSATNKRPSASKATPLGNANWSGRRPKEFGVPATSSGGCASPSFT